MSKNCNVIILFSSRSETGSQTCSVHKASHAYYLTVNHNEPKKMGYSTFYFITFIYLFIYFHNENMEDREQLWGASYVFAHVGFQLLNSDHHAGWQVPLPLSQISCFPKSIALTYRFQLGNIRISLKI